MIFRKNINLIIKIFLLNFLSIFYTIPKLFFISFTNKKLISLAFSSKKLIKSDSYYRVNLNFDSDLIWNPTLPLPFINKKVKSIYSIHFIDKLPLNLIEKHIKYCSKSLLIDTGEYIFSVKDSRAYINAYGNENFSLYCDLFKNNNFVKYGLIDQINHIYREGNKTLFDKDFIENLFLQSGYGNIALREFNFNFDIPQRFYDSLYYTAYK